MINDAQPYIRVAPFMLFFPAILLVGGRVEFHHARRRRA